MLAARFHNALADVVLDVCVALREEHGLAHGGAVRRGVPERGAASSGCLDRLERAGFTVLTHRQVPPNDGGHQSRPGGGRGGPAAAGA